MEVVKDDTPQLNVFPLSNLNACIEGVVSQQNRLVA